MSLEQPSLPKTYKNSKVLFEKDLDAWRQKAEQLLSDVQLNFTQLIKDIFSIGYVYDNDGSPNKPLSLEDRLNQFEGGNALITGTTSDTFTINSDGNAATFDTINLTSSHVYTFPDLDGEFLTDTGIQDVTGAKSFFSQKLKVKGAGAGKAIFDYANTATDRIYTLPDAGANANILLSEGDKTINGDITFGLNTLYIDESNDRVYFGASSTIYTDYQVQNKRSEVGGYVGIFNLNEDNSNTASHAVMSCYTGGSSAGDPSFNLGILGVVNWSIGLDNSDSDKFKVGASDTPGTSTMLTLNSANNTGTITFGTQTSGSFSNKVTMANNGETSFPAVDPPVANYANQNSLVKAWLSWNDAGAAFVGDYNVTGITDDDGDGIFVVNWDTDFILNSYAVSVTAIGTNFEGANFVSLGASSLIVHTFDYDIDTVNYIDYSFSLIAVGDQ